MINTYYVYRAMWIRLDVVRMFIEHTCPPGQSIQRADATNGFQLWKVIKIYFAYQHLTI